MALTNIIVIGIVVIVILGIGGGLGFWFYLSTRTKKITWNAKVYQLGDGVVDLKAYTLAELKPYTQDIIERIDKKNGATYFWLQKLRKAVPVVTADCVEVWGQNNKLVRVLLEEDTCTLLKAGYDKELGSVIFRPVPNDRINMIKTELTERKERIKDKKDILSAIFPYITIGVTMIALVIAIYIIVQGAIKSSENNMIGSEEIANSVNALSSAMLKIYGYDPQNLNISDGREINKEDVPIPP